MKRSLIAVATLCFVSAAVYFLIVSRDPLKVGSFKPHDLKAEKAVSELAPNDNEKIEKVSDPSEALVNDTETDEVKFEAKVDPEEEERARAKILAALKMRSEPAAGALEKFKADASVLDEMRKFAFQFSYEEQIQDFLKVHETGKSPVMDYFFNHHSSYSCTYSEICGCMNCGMNWSPIREQIATSLKFKTYYLTEFIFKVSLPSPCLYHDCDPSGDIELVFVGPDEFADALRAARKDFPEPELLPYFKAEVEGRIAGFYRDTPKKGSEDYEVYVANRELFVSELRKVLAQLK